MTILRRRHNSNFTIVPNAIFERSDLSIEAKGTLGYLLSRPPDWTIRLACVGRVLGIGRDKTERIFQELRDARYVIRGEQRRTGGKWGPAEFEVWDEPNLSKGRSLEATADTLPGQHETAAAPCPEKPLTEKPHAVFQGTYKGLKDNKTESTKDDADDAGARDVGKSMLSDEAKRITDEIGEAAGFTPATWPPGWCGAVYTVQKFLNAGCPGEMLGVVTALRRKRDGPPERFSYFEKPIAQAHAEHAAPLPKVATVPPRPLEIRENYNGRSQRPPGFLEIARQRIRDLDAEEEADRRGNRSDDG
jgi:hypothetical protein